MQKISQLILRLIGWKIVGTLPNLNKYFIIVAPHTSNWDLIIGLLGRFAVGVKIHFLAKRQIFFFPLGLFLKAIGGIPVDRSKKGNMVEQVVDLFESRENLVLGLTPEGTRSPVKRWKEGFYHIAQKAKLPIVMIGFDYSKKEIQVQEPFMPSGEMSADFVKIIAYFRTVKGFHPKELPDYVHKKSEETPSNKTNTEH